VACLSTTRPLNNMRSHPLEYAINMRFHLLWGVSFGGASSGPLELDVLVENNKPLLDTIPCFSQPDSPSTVMAKMMRKVAVLKKLRTERLSRRNLLESPLADQLYSG